MGARETELIAECVDVLGEALPPRTETLLLPERTPASTPRVRGRVQFAGAWGRMDLPYEGKRHINDAVIALMERRQPAPEGDLPGWILFTEYVNPAQARRLREQRIAFADARGNVHVWAPGLHVWVVGNRPASRRTPTPTLTRPAAARVLFALLQKPLRVGRTYRELAGLAGVAPDTVQRVLHDLKARGYLRTWGARERELMRVPELVERWTVGYQDVLRPKLVPKQCRWVEGKSMTAFVDAMPAALGGSAALLGGEAAAAMVTGSLRPTRAVLHVAPDKPRMVMDTLGLVPMPGGPITLISAFGTSNAWEHAPGGALHLADPLLIQAELLRQDDDRARSVAREIYESHIQPRFSRD